MSHREEAKTPRLHLDWTESILPAQWEIYSSAIIALRADGIPFMLGGGFALAAYTGRWRDTKDIDFYINPDDRQRTVEALTRAGFSDFYDRLPYDRKWIYRSARADTIVDLIWAMANQRASVDASWFRGNSAARIRDQDLPLVPIEELLWCKLYILQRDRCDWIDVFNLIYVNGLNVDWTHLLERLGDDTPLLRALLTVYSWFCPARARQLPEWLRTRLALPAPEPAPDSVLTDRLRFLDSRAWFAASKSKGQKLDI